MVVGDFNVVASQEEKVEGYAINKNDVNDFDTMISRNGLTDGGYSSSKYTWCNNRLRTTRILKRLDRAIINAQWISSFVIEVPHLNRACSDHSPILLSFGSVTGAGTSFRFINAWTKHHQFMDHVKETWLIDLRGISLYKFAAKLKLAKAKLRG